MNHLCYPKSRCLFKDLVIMEQGRLPIQQLLDSGTWADVKFRVGHDDPAIIPAYRVLLAMNSAVFRNLFFKKFHEGVCDAKPIDVPDVEPATFLLMLKSVYSGQCEIDDPT